MCNVVKMLIKQLNCNFYCATNSIDTRKDFPELFKNLARYGFKNNFVGSK